MATLPAATDFTGASITEAQFKAAITDLRTFLADQLGTAGTVATALNTLGALCNDYITKSSAYTVVAADRGKLFGCSGTFDLALTAAATLGDGFSFAVRCISGTLTINPTSSELIDGAATFVLATGESCIVVCTGAAWNTIGYASPTNGQYQASQVFTSTGTWTKPAGLKRIKVTVVGGGGGSSGTQDEGVTTNGGGGGGCSMETIEAASLLSSETVTVGAGGAAGSSSNGAGGSGGTSSFGTTPYLSATGGTTSSVGGTGSGGAINIKGSAHSGGDGGSSHMGGGGKGGTNAEAGGNYGGGGGGVRIPVFAAVAGKAGAAGIVIVEEFF